MLNFTLQDLKKVTLLLDSYKYIELPPYYYNGGHAADHLATLSIHEISIQ